jgi:Tol biopolymer transport system component
MRKILIISISILILLGAGFGAFFYFNKPSATVQTSSGVYKLNKISDDVAVSPSVSYDGSAVWYFNPNGQLFRRTLVGDNFSEYAFPQPITNFRKAYWPDANSDLIISTQANSASQFEFYDHSANQFKILPQNIQSLDWMPDGQRILYVWKSGDGKSQQLVLANADTSGFRKVADLSWPDLAVKVSPDGKQALLFRTQSPDVNKIYVASLDTGSIATVVADGKNTDAEWVSPSKFAYVQVADGKNNLNIFDQTTGQSSALGIAANFDQVSFDKLGQYMYSVATDGSSNKLVKYDLATGEQTNIFDFAANIKPHNLFMNDQTVMFINALDGKLYSVGQ